MNNVLPDNAVRQGKSMQYLHAMHMKLPGPSRHPSITKTKQAQKIMQTVTF